MASHICACFYGPDGRCVYCHQTAQDQKIPKKPSSDEPLGPPEVSLGKPGGIVPSYIPFSSWGRRERRRTMLDYLGPELAALLGLEEDDDKPAGTRRDPILGSGEKLGTSRPLPRSGPWFDYSTDCRR